MCPGYRRPPLKAKSNKSERCLWVNRYENATPPVRLEPRVNQTKTGAKAEFVTSSRRLKRRTNAPLTVKNNLSLSSWACQTNWLFTFNIVK
jgi:hypothetical protein